MKIVLLHGMGQTAASWEETISDLPIDWQIHIPDLFANQKLVTYEQLYEALVHECENINEPFHLCGISLGAILACQYAIEHPKKVQSLILIAVQLQPPKYVLKFQQLIFNLLPITYFKKHGIEKAQLVNINRSVQNVDIKESVQRIKCPTIAICGKRDHFNKYATKQFVHLVPHAELVLIEQAGHEVNRENPIELAAVIEEFIGKQSI